MGESKELGLGREEKRGSLVYFKNYRVVERGYYSGYIEVVRGNGEKAMVPPQGILRWPADSEPLTKAQLDLMHDVEQAAKALGKAKRRR
jgi:hypothetical protein